MAWGEQPLDTFREAPSTSPVFGQLMDQGFQLTQYAINATQDIAALSTTPPDLTGIVYNPLTPPSAPLVVPSAPAALTITSPTVGTDPDDTAIVSLLDSLIVAFNAYVSNSTIDTALYNRAVDKQTALQSAGYANYLAGTASDGFTSNPGQDAGAFVFFESEKQKALSAVNRDFFIYKHEADLKALGELRSLSSDYINLLNTQENIMTKRVELFNSINQILVDNQRSKVAGYEAESNITIKQAELIYRQLDSVNAVNLSTANIELKKAEILNTYELGRYNANVEAQKAVSGVMGQLAASSFNAIGLNESWSQSLSWSGSMSL